MGAGSGVPGVAVVGLGYWGPNLVRVLAERTDVDVAVICDQDSSRLGRLARRYPAIRTTVDFDDVVEDPAVDAVLLATPVFTHYDLASRCLEAGKHTFVEKPLASCGEHALELIDLSLEQDVVLMGGHTFVYSPPVRAIKQLIDRGELGELFFVSSSRVNLGLHQRDVSVIWDLGPHDFSILLYWFGEAPSAIRATGRDSIVPGIADIAFVTIEFPSGLIANVELSWLAPSKLRRSVLVGSNKMVVYEDGSAEAIKVYDSGVAYKDPESFGEYQLAYRTGDILTPKLSTDEPLATQLDDFIRAIREGTPREHNLVLSYDVVRLAEAAQASLEDHGARIELHDNEPIRNSRLDRRTSVTSSP